MTDNGGADMCPPIRRVSSSITGSITAFAVLIALALPAPARAQEANAAREHYQKGTSYYDLGRYAEAIHEFEAAYQIKNDPALLYNLAQSHRLAGNSEQALHFYRTYLRYVPKASNRAEIEDRIKQLDQLVSQKTATQVTPPNQTIPPSTSTTTTQTTPPAEPTDRTPMVTAPLPTPTPSPADNPTSSPTNAPVVVSTAAPANDHHAMTRAGLITAAVGGALFIVGAAYGAAAKGAANEVNQQAVQGNPFDPSIERRGKSAQTREAVFMTLGVVAGAVGGTLYFYGRHKARESSGVSITPVASADQAGAVLRVIF